MAAAPGPPPRGVCSLSVTGGSIPRLCLPNLRDCPQLVSENLLAWGTDTREEERPLRRPRSPVPGVTPTAHRSRSWNEGSHGSLCTAKPRQLRSAGRSPLQAEGEGRAPRLRGSRGRKEAEKDGKSRVCVKEAAAAGTLASCGRPSCSDFARLPRKQSQRGRGTWVPIGTPPSTTPPTRSQARAPTDLGGTSFCGQSPGTGSAPDTPGSQPGLDPPAP